MKIKYCLFLTILLVIQSISSLQAQTTEGTDFWLTFGKNAFYTFGGDLQIRIVSKDKPTQGSIYFTELGTEQIFDLEPREVYTYALTTGQKDAVYNSVGGWTTSKSIHITCTETVTVYALNQRQATTDATNVLPVTALGMEYYQISYQSVGAPLFDAYAIIATENNTKIYHNTTEVASLNYGQVYYNASSIDMTGEHITADKLVAFFAVNQFTHIPVGYGDSDCLMQQLAPVKTWGKKFFVPVTHLTKERVRIVASQDNTQITQIGGIVISGNLNNLHAGQFVELEAVIENNGCYIQADKPIGVCTYLTGGDYNGMVTSDPAQAWLPAMKQTTPEALIAPFVPVGYSNLIEHFALVVTPTATKDNTEVSIGAGVPAPLSGDIWRDNTDAGMSFYTMPLTNTAASYFFTNEKGLIVMGYGTGSAESYYYLGYSAMRELEAAFYANDVHFQDLTNTTFCEKMVNFRAELEGEIHPDPESIKWFIDGVEYFDARDLLEWNKSFETGEYDIEMQVRFENNEIKSRSSTLKVRVFWTKIKNIKH